MGIIYNDKAVDILVSVKELLGNQNQEQVSKQLEQLATAKNLDLEQLNKIYQLMIGFYEEMESLGGEEKYQITGISWLGVELELLFESYRLCIGQGMNIVDISHQLSSEYYNIFPKTPSQLQNTYYRVKKEHLPFETIIKNKPGRKRKTDASFISKKERLKMVAQQEKIKEDEQKSQADYNLDTSTNDHDKNLVVLLSGLVNNFQAIQSNNQKGNEFIYQLMESIYQLSAIAAQKSATNQKYENVELELQLLRSQLEETKREKEELIHDFRNFASHIQEFTNSPELTQIKQLPQFIEECKEQLASFGLPLAKEKDIKMFIDSNGQLVTVSQ